MRIRKAFSLIEILIAMAILTGTVYVLSDLHIRSMMRLMRDRELFLKFFSVKNALVEHLPLVKRNFKLEKKVIEEEELQLTIEEVGPPSKSPLKDILGERLTLLKAAGSWKTGPFTHQIEFLSIAQREEEPADAKE